jgi:DNA polymerase-1
MEKILLVDGNNLVFRSYFATAYTGNLMKNKKGFPTNAIYGFVNMINKIITEEKPTYMIVAFDKGKTFRHEKYTEYKAGRNATPEELKMQMPICKEILTLMGIKYYECDNYEADDILGTFSSMCVKDPNFIGTIISSDKDLLQLITKEVDMKLLKQKDYIRYNEVTFKEDYGIEPINIIDLKALMGDASDNIPGVSGIGEKTALKLLQEHKTLDGVYKALDTYTPKMKEKLIKDKENAYMSYDLATIVKDVPLNLTLEDAKIGKINQEELNKKYEELEFFSFLSKQKEKPQLKEVTILKDANEINLTKPASIYLEILGTNYHTSKVLGVGIYNEETSFFIPAYLIKQAFDKIKDHIKYTYDLKKLYVALKWMNIEIKEPLFDTQLAAYLLDYNVKDDIAYLAGILGYQLPFYENVYMETKTKPKEPPIEEIAKNCVAKAKFIYEVKDNLKEKIKEEDMEKLLYEIEEPLSLVLGDMEVDGVYVNQETLNKMGVEMNEKLQTLTEEIYTLAGTTFNIASPKQLGEILFEKLELKGGKKSKTGVFSTSVEILEKLKGKHPIIEKILEYRLLSKLYTTYIEGLKQYILEDGKIHTIYTQALTRTGRLSSIEPNLQNIPIRNEYGKQIRKAFVPSENSIIISGDYSQIELRILSHMANVETMIEAFKKEEDIHTATASKIFKIKEEEVTKNQRRIAKAVNFGIIYGISSYGLSENIGISVSEAKTFIENYLETYPGIKDYMESQKKKAYELGYVKTLFGRKRIIEELQNKNYMIRSSGERIALNTPIQGTSADIIKLAMVKVKEEMKKRNLKSKMIIQVHDELVFDCLKEEKEEVISLLRQTMEHIVSLNVPLKIDVEEGTNWYEAK